MESDDLETARELDRELAREVVRLLGEAEEVRVALARAAAGGLVLDSVIAKLDALIAASNRAETALSALDRIEAGLAGTTSRGAGEPVAQPPRAAARPDRGDPPAPAASPGAPAPAASAPAASAPGVAAPAADPAAGARRHAPEARAPDSGSPRGQPRSFWEGRGVWVGLGLLAGVLVGAVGMWAWQRPGAPAEERVAVTVPPSPPSMEARIEAGWRTLLADPRPVDSADRTEAEVAELRAAFCSTPGAPCRGWAEVAGRLAPDERALLIGALRRRLGADPCVRLVPRGTGAGAAGAAGAANAEAVMRDEVACLLSRLGDPAAGSDGR